MKCAKEIYICSHISSLEGNECDGVLNKTGGNLISLIHLQIFSTTASTLCKVSNIGYNSWHYYSHPVPLNLSCLHVVKLEKKITRTWEEKSDSSLHEYIQIKLTIKQDIYKPWVLRMWSSSIEYDQCYFDFHGMLNYCGYCK